MSTLLSSGPSSVRREAPPTRGKLKSRSQRSRGPKQARISLL
uniref:Uncharacterized protein n=1 Tax=Vitis vinifera TaxID=29760 RepID=F6HCR7_VITVI